MEGKYVTVTVCVENRAIKNLILRLEHHVTQNYQTSQAVQRVETDLTDRNEIILLVDAVGKCDKKNVI